jgi:hypothetical protein
MARYKTGMVIVDVLETHRKFDRVLVRLSQLALNPRIRRFAQRERRKVLLAYDQFNRDLETLAQRTAQQVDLEIQRQLARTAKRPDTRTKPHIRDHIVSRPSRLAGIPTGWVGTADIDELDKVVNPLSPGYGPYWRTQEEGYTGHVGRRIHGLFFGAGMSGGGEPPRAVYRGGGGPHPIFVASPIGGPGVIQESIAPRRFIANGNKIVGVKWLAQLKAIERAAIARM